MKELFSHSPTQEFLAPHGRGGGGQPQGPQRLTKAQRTQQRHDERRAADRDERIRQGRIRALKWVGGAVLTGAALVGAAQTSPGRALVESVTGIQESSLTGEVEQTRDVLQKLIGEVQRNPRNAEQYIPKILELGVTYFSKQMVELFPEKAQQYNKEKFKDIFEALSEQDFVKNSLETDCVPVPNHVPASADFIGGKVYYQPQRMITNSRSAKEFVYDIFHMIIHESLHMSSIFKAHETPVSLPGVSRPVLYQKGLGSVVKDEEASRRLGKDCFGTYFRGMEEIVVEDVTFELVGKVGIQIEDINSNYLPAIQLYRREIRAYYPGGEFKELLQYQQASDHVGFLTSLGKTIAKTEDPTKQLDNGIVVGRKIESYMTQRYIR